MTTSLAPTGVSSSAPSRFHIAVAGLAVLACLPYLALKVHWLLGGSIGLNDTAVATSTTMEVANLLTAGMELVGAALAVLLILPVGRRIPAPLLHVPMFVGTGLLGGILLLVPTRALLTQGRPASDVTRSDPIEEWVYTVVYGGFVVLGLCLLTIFVGYAWRRWVLPGGWATRLGALPQVGSALRQQALARGSAMLAVCVVGALLSARADVFHAHDVVALVMSAVALAGLSALATPAPRRLRARVPLLMIYVGSAAVAAWGAFFAVMLTVPNPLMGSQDTHWGLALVGVLRAVTGVLAVLTVRDLAPRSRRSVGVSGRISPARPARRAPHPHPWGG